MVLFALLPAGPAHGVRDFPDRPTVSLIPRVDSADVTPRHRGGYDVNPTPNGGDDETPPDPCTTPFDAITVIRTEVFLFIGKVSTGRGLYYQAVYISANSRISAKAPLPLPPPRPPA